MATEAKSVSTLPSSPKARLLKFLAEQSRPVSAKEAAVHLDSRTSSASELLERCAAQGLCARGENDRPRLYSLTEQGRERLRWLGIQPAQPARPDSEIEENDSRAGDEEVEETAGVDRAAAGEILSEVRALREDVRDLSEIVAAGRSSGASPQSERQTEPKPEEAEELIRRADTLSRETNEKRPEKLREMLLRDVDALRQSVAAAQESGALAVILPKPIRRMLFGKRRKDAAFGADAIAAKLRKVSQTLGGSEKLPAPSAADLAADAETARNRLLSRARNVQKLFERARKAEAISDLAGDAERLSAFFEGLTQRLENASVPESKLARKGTREK